MKKNLLVILSTLIVCAALGPLASQSQAQRGGGGTPALDATARAALISALTNTNGEYAAHAEYTAILATHGTNVQPYARILQAEKQHIAALQAQCVNYGIPVPADTYLGQVMPPASLLEAAQIGVFAEMVNVAMYDRLLTQVRIYPSLVQVFSNLRWASLNNHLPAFTAALNNGGTCPAGPCQPAATQCDQTQTRAMDRTCRE